MTAEQRRQMQALGIDPDFYKTAAAAAEKRGQERASYYDALAEKLAGQQKSQGIIDFLLGAKGFRGQGLGAVLGSGAAAARAGEAATEEKTQKIMELKLQAQDAAIKDKQLLDKARYETAMGDFDKARKTLEEREKNRQAYERKEAEIRAGYGKEIADRLTQMRGQDIQREVGLARTESGGERQTLAELKALQSGLEKQVKDFTLPKETRQRAAALLEQTTAKIASMAGLSEGAAPATAGTRPPLSSFQR